VFENLFDQIRTVPMIVIAENGGQRNPRELLENPRTWFGMPGSGRTIALEQRMGDEISGKEDEIGVEGARDADDTLHLVIADIGAEVKITHHENASSFKRRGQARETYHDVLDRGVVWLTAKAVDGCKSTEPCATEKELSKETSAIHF
jgi:hypothetical protein